MQLTVCADVTWPSSHCPGESGAQGTGKNANSQAVVIAVSNKQSFVSDPGARADTKLCQATLYLVNRIKSQLFYHS